MSKFESLLRKLYQKCAERKRALKHNIKVSLLIKIVNIRKKIKLNLILANPGLLSTELTTISSDFLF